MGSVVDIVYNTNNYSFDFSTYIITVGMDKLLVPDLYRAIRLAEVSVVGIAHPSIAKGEGLAILDSDGSDTIQTSLTVSLYKGWLVLSSKVTGIFSIKNGNLVADPVGSVFAENPLVTYIGFFSESGTIARVSTGSAVTEQDKIDIITGVWSDISGDIVVKMLHNNVTKSGDIITIYEADGITIWNQFDLANGGRVKL